MRVAEYGRGSGYSTELIARLVGPTGEVTSLDTDAFKALFFLALMTPTAHPPRTRHGPRPLLHPDRSTGRSSGWRCLMAVRSDGHRPRPAEAVLTAPGRARRLPWLR
ncbi:hypothetical protein [Streptomyces decoyicus]|uniref:hypothetical protein n=1 Tax=Streptomyces decoyicus TaxID=249567 RepID=UPI0006C3DB2B|nr:hypothetical protein [Streptomyces decoyicus]KOG41264.1 hypothetical protein ADK74_22275 [Streptomyces decoyicus]QZY20172.1 hypothetical protein K7C20_37305 [Streptomyces decoyicus]